MPTQPQYYENTLQPIQINQTTLQQTLKELQQAVIQGTKLVQAGSPAPKNSAEYGSIYTGSTGIALAFLRLERQKASLADQGQDISHLPDFAKLANERIIPAGSSDMRIPRPGRMSPVGSSLGPVVVRILAVCEDPTSRPVSQDEINLLKAAVQSSLNHAHAVPSGDEIRGVDEVLYGRAGLLWAVLSVRSHVVDQGLRANLSPVAEAVPRLVDVIVGAGRRGARDFVSMHGEKNAFALMWPYKDERYSLGAVHGITGILTTLLSCETEELENYLPLIANTITGLCQICIANHGHLPSSIPPHSSSRSSHLVQICHGAPGLLIALASARKHQRLRTAFWQPEWNQAIRLASDKIWQEGLLTKGGSLCHGLTGNAWSLLMLHDSFESDSENSDYFLSRALSLLLIARESPPYSTALKVRSSYNFRMPDRPYSLYEGLAGELCAWAEACVVIQGRLCGLGLNEEDREQYQERELGIPCLGGNMAKGIM